MVDPKKMSVEEILAACRGGSSSSSSPPESKPALAKDEPSAATGKPAASKPVESKPAAGKPAGAKPGGMNTADILAAARGGAAKSEPASASDGPAPAKSAPGAKSPPAAKPGAMSVADILAAARKGAGAAKETAAEEKPAAKKAPPAKPAAAKAAAQAEPEPVSGAKDTSSILAAARKGVKPGPISKEEAKQRATATIEKPEKSMPVRPAKPAYAIPSPPVAAQSDRRDFFAVVAGSFLAVGFSSFALTNVVWLLGLARFMFPNVLTEPPSKFKVGFSANFAPDTVSDNFKAQFGVWVVNTVYEGQRQIVALRTVCTHLGCTPNWLEAEQKFKCPCHGSGFYKDGVNFEGPAPRPLERYAIQLADDGQLEVDKSRIFYSEKGEWGDSASFVAV
ncbi:MAG: Rieske 2Fe-2S domain-containing protein [Planctomycetota bacterium]|nr:Rieske 2Fe-2S domain-containing protein [Planctomycetota bacterium]MDA1179524.1 Rieske 2Fe-2S domain-containing protein [Planctomycetota bacterium]